MHSYTIREMNHTHSSGFRLRPSDYNVFQKYYFYLKDHLDNNRVVVDESGNVVQTVDYYPTL
jgi:hypothetical protein